MATTPRPVTSKERATLEEVANRLSRRFPHLNRSVVVQAVEDQYIVLAGAPIRDFIPVLVERAARQQLERI